ncbi:homocysteine S-methyltransferase family protein [uncultured Clostridium sp.]|uniref:homocysteine S-methyltransferase family protein n=1 Tax=uncultured Clostridium sp. TaxID=59620 RepID=UPI0025E768EE|nr:homocysteine S-methyltransferase family protein [uncultured Clostridium sp.]
MKVLEELKTKILLFDGGTGSLLQEAGLKPGELPETWNIIRPDFMMKLHRDYLEAGCDIIKTNTFGANRFKYSSSSEYGLKEIVTAAMDNAKRAVEEAGRGYIALDLGPTGKLLKPMGQLDFEEAVSVYREVVEIGASQGADLILIETMSDTYELKAAVLAARENSALPVFATVIFDEKGKMLTGGTPKAVIGMLEGLRVDAIGMNCGLGPVQMKPLAAEFLKYASVPVIVNPNAGLPRSEGGRTVYDIGPDEFETAMKEILDLGVNVAGGCCGTTPEHIKRLDRLRTGREQRLPEEKQFTVATSYASAVEFGADPVIIGERINPTGKAKYKQALMEKNMEFILEEGIAQQESGAHVLDINVGLPEIDEPEIMALAVRELQGITELPLQIDTTNTEAMARAMRIYNGKIMVNSVNGKQEMMDAVFPLVKRYGGVVVALTLDEEGIPGTSEGRIGIAKKIYREAEKYGIGKKDILIDALCMTVSSDPLGALTTLETVRRIRDELGGKTILGVSNISFGLPVRENINANFFTMALYSGLNAAIINPGSEPMMCSYHSFRALAALDENCAGYIAAYRYAGQPSAAGAGLMSGDMYPKSPESPEITGPSDTSETPGGVLSGESGEARLFLSVLKGLKEQAARAAGELLSEKEPLDVIDTCMIPALDRVGKGYEAGTVFLPQLLMSAEAAKAAFDVIREKLDETGRTGEKKGKIILATVKGDIHDIGKNIVRVLLENYGYEVIDLGKDVPPERIVREAEEKRVPLVGLSALMTTTVPAMQRTIAELKEKAPWVKVMVGGAVLTPDYAEMIGADAYCSDAMASVSYARKIIG